MNENRRRRNLSSEEREKEIVVDGMHQPLDKVNFVCIIFFIFRFFSILILSMLHDLRYFFLLIKAILQLMFYLK